MVSSASARDRFYRTIQPILGDEAADFLMDALPPMDGDEVATKTDIRLVGSELRSEMAELRSEMRTGFAELRGEMSAMATKADLAEQLRLHVDASVGKASRLWFFSVMGMQAATIAGVIAAVRL